MTKQTLCTECLHRGVCKHCESLKKIQEICDRAIGDIIHDPLKCSISCASFKSKEAGGAFR